MITLRWLTINVTDLHGLYCKLCKEPRSKIGKALPDLLLIMYVLIKYVCVCVYVYNITVCMSLTISIVNPELRKNEDTTAADTKGQD